MPRSIKVRQECAEEVRLAYRRQGCARQKDLADELGMCLDTIRKYLNRKPISCENFQEISLRLNLDWQKIAHFSESDDYSEPMPNDEEQFIYVERPPIESTCYAVLQNPNALIRIKAPGLMGKTALALKTLRKFDLQAGYRTVYLNLHSADEKDFSNLNHFLQWFCVSVAQSLHLHNLLSDQWDEQFSTPKINCTSYFEKNFLPLDKGALVLCLDDVDRIFSRRVLASEFLGLLRAWHEQAKTKVNWKKLKLIVVHSTEPYIPLNINESPFNVGEPIDLPEFTLVQVQELCQLHGLDWMKDQIQELMEMVGGHPYLIERALSHLKNNPNISLEELLQTAVMGTGVYQNHLRHLRCMLEKRPELKSALAEIVNADYPVALKSEQSVYQLVSMGVINFKQENQLIPRCKLYRKYFHEHL